MTEQKTVRLDLSTGLAFAIVLIACSVGCDGGEPCTTHDAGAGPLPAAATDGGAGDVASLCFELCTVEAAPTEDYCTETSEEACRSRCLTRLQAAPDPNELCIECLLEGARFATGSGITLPLRCEWTDECEGRRCEYRGCPYCELDEAAETACRESTREAIECALELGDVRECADICG